MDNSKNITFAKSQLALAESGHLERAGFDGACQALGDRFFTYLHFAGFNDSRADVADNHVFVKRSDADEFCKGKVIYVKTVKMSNTKAVEVLERAVKIEENRGKYW